MATYSQKWNILETGRRKTNQNTGQLSGNKRRTWFIATIKSRIGLDGLSVWCSAEQRRANYSIVVIRPRHNHAFKQLYIDRRGVSHHFRKATNRPQKPNAAPWLIDPTIVSTLIKPKELALEALLKLVRSWPGLRCSGHRISIIISCQVTDE